MGAVPDLEVLAPQQGQTRTPEDSAGLALPVGRQGSTGRVSAGCCRVRFPARWRRGSVGICGRPCRPGRGR